MSDTEGLSSRGVGFVVARLLRYGDVDTVDHEGLVVLDVWEKGTGREEFRILCRMPAEQGSPEGRYTIELDNGRQGTVLVVGKRFPDNFIELTLSGEGELR